MFGHWLVALKKFPFKPEDVKGANGSSINLDCPFTEKTFELMAQLVETPTAAFYKEHKQEFVRYVEEPFKRVLHEVAQRFPEPIRVFDGD